RLMQGVDHRSHELPGLVDSRDDDHGSPGTLFQVCRTGPSDGSSHLPVDGVGVVECPPPRLPERLHGALPTDSGSTVNERMAVATSPGALCCTTWPHPGISSMRPRGALAARIAVHTRPATGSRAPRITSTGQDRSAMRRSVG